MIGTEIKMRQASQTMGSELISTDHFVHSAIKFLAANEPLTIAYSQDKWYISTPSCSREFASLPSGLATLIVKPQS